MKNKDEKIVELLLCIFLGCFGAHRFYRKDIKMGIVYLLTGGLVGIGWLVDLVRLIIDLTNSSGNSVGSFDQTYMSANPGRSRKITIICVSVGAVIIILGIIGAVSSKGNSKSDDRNTTYSLALTTTSQITTTNVTTTVATTEVTTIATTVTTTEAEEYVAPAQESYDYVVNTKSKKYHKKSCGSVKKMNEENKLVIHATPDEMQNRGYEACDKCKP